MKTYYNLAYGSNMSTKRLFARLSNATHIGVATVTGYQLAYHKLGVDESGKCDAFYTGDPQDMLYGVLYALNEDEKAILDEIEGARYSEAQIKATHNGQTFEAYCYVANMLDNSILPYDWYLQHVITGAIEAELPKEYIEKIKQQAVKVDPDKTRAAREFAIHQK